VGAPGSELIAGVAGAELGVGACSTTAGKTTLFAAGRDSNSGEEPDSGARQATFIINNVEPNAMHRTTELDHMGKPAGNVTLTVPA
jgi:hypothetical protein